ncbi:MAG: transglycosylase SLT domain-containing protein [Bacteriovoracaceae bacterium]
MKKLLLLLMFFAVTASTTQALAPESIFQNEFLMTEDILSRYAIHPNIKSPTSLVSNQLVLSILQDRDHKINNEFHVPKYFMNATRFWFGIYTQYSSDHIVIHDKDNLKLIYDIMDFGEVSKSTLNRFVKNSMMQKATQDRLVFIKKLISELAKSPKGDSPANKRLLNLVKLAGYQIPKSQSGAKSFFIELSDRVRTQTGQRDMIYQGVLNAIPYLPYMEEQAKIFELPKEILAIPFLESSFNTKAKSKVGASGIWQIMPIIDSKVISKDKLIDGRGNPFIATIAAFHLLKENYRILDRWDMAVTAYNSGTKHLLKATKTLKLKSPTLQSIFEKYEHPHLGFASKNFYAEFLALVHVLAYRNLVYPLNKVQDPDYLNIRRNNVDIYVSKCNFIPNTVFEQMNKISPDLEKINQHLLNPKNQYAKGNIFISDVHLNTTLFYKLSGKEMRENYPINWNKIVKNYRCSTK